MTRQPRRGLTLVELLVVAAIITNLILLLLPAINVTREAARRDECINRARQLALAVVNHETMNEYFPLANSAPPRPGDRSNLGRIQPGLAADQVYLERDRHRWNNDGYSWIVKILPHMNENLLYDQIAKASEQFTLTAFNPLVVHVVGDPTSHVATTPIDALRCPSFAGKRDAQDPSNYNLPGNAEVAGGNYVALAAATRGISMRNQVDDHEPRYGGTMISGPGRVTLRELIDGTSKTVIICESKAEKYSSWYSGQSAWTIGFHPDVAPRVQQQADGINGILDDGNLRNSPRLNWGRPLAVQPGTPQANDSWFSTTQTGDPRDWGPSSDHDGVVVHSYADGNAQAIDDAIDATVYFRLITRAGDKPVDPNAL